MTDTELLSYVGAITGVIGAITGIAGAVMGYFSFRKTGEIKALELRLELAKAGGEVFHKAEALGDLLDRAEKSRSAVASAMGLFKSGAHEKWMRQLKADNDSLASLNKSLDEMSTDYSNAPLHELEVAIVELHGLRTIITAITEKYIAAMDEDDRNREFLRSQAHAGTNR